jgi:lipoprotein-anchoring transpeptidase ErfK/SrfK
MLPRPLIFAAIAIAITLTTGRAISNFLYYHLSPQHTLTPESIASDFDPSATTAFFDNQPVSVPSYLSQLLEPPTTQPPVLGSNTSSKRIEVDLTQQRIYAYEGDRQVYNYLISSGKWGKTPTGTFNIWIKLRSTKMSGGSKALRTYYYLPNVPYVMYFHNNEVPKQRGFGIHGAYWHNNFGHPMSHGCINMKPEEVAQLYYWAQPELKGKNSIHASDDNPGTPIIIYGTAPQT